MKTKSIFCALLACAAALALTPQTSQAAVGTETLQITNVIPLSTILIGDPTNGVSCATNSSGWLLGRAVNVDNYDTVNIRVEGNHTLGGSTNISDGVTNYWLVTTNYLQIDLVRSSHPNAPQPSSSKVWDSTTSFFIRVPINGTTPVSWSTNIPPSWLGGARWIGANRITNTCGGGAGAGAFSNLVVTIEKKILPVVFP